MARGVGGGGTLAALEFDKNLHYNHAIAISIIVAIAL
jgi:hypothetical protein